MIRGYFLAEGREAKRKRSRQKRFTPRRFASITRDMARLGRARSLTVLLLLGLVFSRSGLGAESFRVATYNLENYLEAPAGTRPVKSPEGKAKIRESLRALNAEVVALQEI